MSAGLITLSIESVSLTSLSLSWALDIGYDAPNYTISFTNTNTDCFTENYNDIATSETSYTLIGLQEGSEYFIKVTAPVSGGGTALDSLTATTNTDGLCYLCPLSFSYYLLVSLSHSSICCSKLHAVGQESHYCLCQV